MNNDLINREALKETFDVAFFNDEDDYKKALRIKEEIETLKKELENVLTDCKKCKHFNKKITEDPCEDCTHSSNFERND